MKETEIQNVLNLQPTAAENMRARITAYAAAGIPVFVAGPPGCAKTSMLSEIGQTFDYFTEERPSTWDPVDARGMPVVRRLLDEVDAYTNVLKSKLQLVQSQMQQAKASNDAAAVDRAQSRMAETLQTLEAQFALADSLVKSGKTTELSWPHLDWLPPVGHSGTTAILFDELNTAAQAVLNVMLQPFLPSLNAPRKIGPHTIPGSNVWICATGNRPEDAAQVQPMSFPLRDRFVLETVDPHTKDFKRSWVQWAWANNVHKHIIGFLEFQSDMIYVKPQGDFVQGATPRSWSEQANALVHAGIYEVEALKGAIGSGVAAQFNAYVQEVDNLPNMKKLLSGEETFDFGNSNMSLVYAVMTELTAIVREDPKVLGKAANVATQAKPEHAGMFITACLRSDNMDVKMAVTQTPEVLRWAKKHRATLNRKF